MGVGNILYCFLAVSTISLACSVDEQKPNIVFIIADDMGWYDVSLHGSNQIPTPNIDLLGLTGVAFGRYYSHAICTPARSALLTGKYSYNLGMQAYPLSMAEDRGIPFKEKLLPQYLKEVGYTTHLVGKWHVGSSRNGYLPTSRGFDSHFGHRGGYVDYYEYTVEEELPPLGKVSGLPFFKNDTPAWDVQGYITDVYSEHAASIIKQHNESSPLFLMVAHNAPHAGNDASSLQAPPEEVRKMRHIELTPRRMYAAMVKKLDDSVGEIVTALHDKGILDNTIIVFVSDNGGMTSGELNNYASNYPLRGLKFTPFEGGMRVVGVVWSKCLKNSGHFYNGYMHISDWLPTLLTAAGEDVPSGIDGVSQWESINMNTESNRKAIFEIDDLLGNGAVIFGDYKLVTGNININYSDHQGGDLRESMGKEPSYKDAIFNSAVYNVLKLHGSQFEMPDIDLRRNTIIECGDTNVASICQPSESKPCLFNIIEDPCEFRDLSDEYPDLVQQMKDLYMKEYNKRVPRYSLLPRSTLAAPSVENDFTWNTWLPDSAPLSE